MSGITFFNKYKIIKINTVVPVRDNCHESLINSLSQVDVEGIQESFRSLMQLS